MFERDRMPGAEALSALPIVTLPNVVLLPGMVLPLNVFEPRYLDLVDHVLGTGQQVGVALLRPGHEQAGHCPAFEPVCGLGRLLSHQRLPDGRRFVRVEGLGRVKVVQELAPRVSFREVEAELLPEGPPADPRMLEILKAQVERIAGALAVDDGEMVRCVLEIADPRVLVYAIAAIVPTFAAPDPDDHLPGRRSTHVELQQRCLAASSAGQRVEILLAECNALCAMIGDTRTMLN